MQTKPKSRIDYKKPWGEVSNILSHIQIINNVHYLKSYNSGTKLDN